MPGVYREKECPTCGVKHRKKGKYCGQSCASKHYRHSEESKEKISNALKEEHKKPERIAQARMLKQGTLTHAEDFAIAIPDIHDLSDYDDHLTGFDRAEDW